MHEMFGSWRNLAIFVVVLLVLRRFVGIQISIVGSIALTIIVSLIVSRFGSRPGGPQA